MASAVVNSGSTRRHHYQSQISNASLSLSQSFSTGESSNFNESFSTLFTSSNPLVTIIYFNASSPKAMEAYRRSSSVSSIAVKTADMKKQPILGICTFIRLIYGDNQLLLLNSYASCRRLLDHVKLTVGVQQDETIDLMDNEGKLKELDTHFDEYASQYLTARNTYYVLKVEIDNAKGEKRYTANFNLDQIDPKLHSLLTTSLNALNKSTKTPKRNGGTSKQNTPLQSTSNAQSRTKKLSNRKQN